MRDPTRPIYRRGELTGKQTEGQPLNEGTKYTRCRECGGMFDVLDFAAMCDHDFPGHECPPSDRIH